MELEAGWKENCIRMGLKDSFGKEKIRNNIDQ
jgi:hypothetical protein